MQLQGSICALITPFDASGDIDRESIASLVEWHIGAGTRALVVAGSTGEAALLEEDEYHLLIESAVRFSAGRLSVIAGIGSPSTRKSLGLSKYAHAAGADAVLAVTPYYVRPTQEGLIAHYRLLAEESGLPLLLYNVPSRTGCDLLPSTVEKLASHVAIIGIKEAVADALRMRELLSLRDSGFCIISGDDPTAARSMLAGAAATISVAANIVPRTFARMCEFANHARTAEASELDQHMQPIYRALGVESNPIPVKWLLYRLGKIGKLLRLPLQPLADRHKPEVDACLADIQRLEGLLTNIDDRNS